ncbi:GNAT family N-acetyltransferase [Nocardioides speluncae]|uniref:GNAT family N-acetyltransferase n=1 Tax=Nocardioides speluncae TaxID=2670337 RepID=UPI001F0CD491|nr:GNAT family N-acetyltransferase [Nocardioides speluncae]
MAIAPDADHHEELARQLVTDLTQPERGVLPRGKICVEARFGAAFQALLVGDGWSADEPWTPLSRDLSKPVDDCGLRVAVIGPEEAPVCTAVHRSAFGSAKFIDERWHAMASGPAYADARCLVGYDGQGRAVATTTVWSAGPGKPGLLEPVGVHQDHRGHGYGKAISVAAAAALRELGSSSAIVCTPSANVGAVAAYVSAGFRAHPEVRDRCRDT